MVGSQVFIFGSFSEDEASALQKASSQNDANLLNILQFGSFKKQTNGSLLSDQDNVKHKEGHGKNVNGTQNDGCLVTKEMGQPKKQLFNGTQSTVLNELQASKSLINSIGLKNDLKETSVYSSMPASCPFSQSFANTVADTNNVRRGNIEVDAKLIQNKVTVNVQSLSFGNNDIEDDTAEKESDSLVSIPLSWAAKIGGKASNGHAAHSQSSRSMVSKVNSTTASSGRLHLKGLVNTGNLCFMNSILQALLACLPFVHLLQSIKHRNIPKVGFPTLTAFVEFILKMEEGNVGHQKFKQYNQSLGGIDVGVAFFPTMFEPVLKSFSPEFYGYGRTRQEDAQEFLSFVMDQMHRELLNLEKSDISSSDGSDVSLVTVSEDDGWETVGPKNQTAVTRTQAFKESELTAIFGGELRSLVKSKGNKASATIQPFLILQMDIAAESIYTVEDALHQYASPESLDDYRGSTGKAGIVSARKSVKLQKLPKILILQLVRFSYGSFGCKKLHKAVRFKPEIQLSRELLVSPNVEGRNYELVATVTHHGKDHSRGHYTTDAKYSDAKWIRFDDASVYAVELNKVLHEQAYLLFYRQM